MRTLSLYTTQKNASLLCSQILENVKSLASYMSATICSGYTPLIYIVFISTQTNWSLLLSLTLRATFLGRQLEKS